LVGHIGEASANYMDRCRHSQKVVRVCPKDEKIFKKR